MITERTSVTDWLVKAAEMMEAEGFKAQPGFLRELMKRGFKVVWSSNRYTYMYVILGHQAYICNFVVHPDHRREGLGPRVTKQLFDRLREVGVTHVYGEANRPGWLRALGMRSLGHGKWVVKEL